MFRLLLLIVGLILYGSLYPWRFADTPYGPASVFQVLLSGQAGVFYARDALVNVFFYVPVGACAYLALRPRIRGGVAGTLGIALGLGLSMAVEVAQGFEVTRRTSIFDVYANLLGSALGVAVAVAFSRLGTRLRLGEEARMPDVAALALIACWLAYLMFPFLPLLTGRTLGVRLEQTRIFSFLSVASAAAAWFVVGYALRASGVRNAAAVCFASTLLVPMQLLIFRREPVLGEFAGALVGSLAFARVRSRPWGSKVAAGALLMVLIARGLSPFQIADSPKAFGWIPFVPLLLSDWYRASQVLSTKLFFYAAAVWSLRNAGARLRSAATATAALLLAIEVVQRWIPVHSPEITDPLLVLMIGIGFDALRSTPKRTSNPSETSA